MNWFKLFPADVFDSSNFVKLVVINDKKICVVKVDHRFFAVQNKCPHAGASLSLGYCIDKKIVCPYHRFEYDLETGKGSPGQNDYIDTFPIDVREDGVYIGFKEKRSYFKNMFAWLLKE
ncbi:MAG: Rieske (2Fe-2S) protein [Daejeonella sp.]|nr:Rieske (2Fe-2S) protein [Daejeonella sp.]